MPSVYYFENYLPEWSRNLKKCEKNDNCPFWNIYENYVYKNKKMALKYSIFINLSVHYGLP